MSKDVKQGRFDGYDVLDTEVVSTELKEEGEYLEGVYDGVDERPMSNGKVAEYLVLRTEDEGLKGIPVNSSLKRVVKKLKEGQHIIVELFSLVKQSGRPQAFKQYRVHIMRQTGSQKDIPF